MPTFGQFFLCLSSKNLKIRPWIKHLKMKQLLISFILLFNGVAFAQTLSVSEEISINGSDGYGIIGKYNDRILFFLLNNNEVKLRAYDNKLHKLWERDLEQIGRAHV